MTTRRALALAGRHFMVLSRGLRRSAPLFFCILLATARRAAVGCATATPVGQALCAQYLLRASLGIAAQEVRSSFSLNFRFCETLNQKSSRCWNQLHNRVSGFPLFLILKIKSIVYPCSTLRSSRVQEGCLEVMECGKRSPLRAA